MTEDEPFRSVWMTPELMETICTRDNDGNRLVVDWGEPDQNGYYVPSVTVDYTDNVVADERARILAAVEAQRDAMAGYSQDRRLGYAEGLAAVIAAIKGEET
jgi:hypothetical protein